MANIDDRKKEIVNACLDKLVNNGLYETSSRDLSSAIKLQSGGLYYYFKTKSNVIIACAEEAASRLELNLIIPALADADNPERLLAGLVKRAKDMSSTMRFFVSVCIAKQYSEDIKPVINRISKRFDRYVNTFADKMGCSSDELKPYFYICLNAIVNYMIFEDQSQLQFQTRVISAKITEWSKNKHYF